MGLGLLDHGGQLAQAGPIGGGSGRAVGHGGAGQIPGGAAGAQPAGAKALARADQLGRVVPEPPGAVPGGTGQQRRPASGRGQQRAEQDRPADGAVAGAVAEQRGGAGQGDQGQPVARYDQRGEAVNDGLDVGGQGVVGVGEQPPAGQGIAGAAHDAGAAAGGVDGDDRACHGKLLPGRT